MTVVAGVQFGFPLIQELEGGGCVADFVAEIVGDSAVRIQVEKVLAETRGQKPGGYREIFVMGARQAFTVCSRFGLGRGCFRDGVLGRKSAPARGGRSRREMGGAG